ncbi:MAG: LuxR C-terminal-related transcriptional regulator [Chloroflexi bacterium]|nr:LuxR C-terminal-related transcriptional regulator [Chloroflexota bacterium]
MSESLLKTKLYIPPTPLEWVSRSRLIERLQAGLDRKLTLVCAPAGFGKTTLLSEWVRTSQAGRSGLPPAIAWLSMDEDDNSPAQFWTYFIAAVQTVWPRFAAFVLPILESPQSPSIRSILTDVINEMADNGEELCVVLDDFQMIQSGQIHKAVGFFVDHLPPNVHLIIASRSEPPLSLSRLRGRGQLNELRADDLSFNADETRAFLNDVSGLALSDDTLSVLEEKTEGWIASLQMLAKAIQGRQDVDEFLNDFGGTHRYIMEYLLQEVLRYEGSDLQSFLLKTSVLKRLSGPLCDAVTERNDGQQMLEQVMSANLFLVPLDDQRIWFRYHHLFSDLLRSEMSRAYPNMERGFHKRASVWLEREGFLPEAIDHALTICEFERAAYLIEAIAKGLIHQSRLSLPSHWLAQLPMELITARRWLCMSLASIRMVTGQYDQAEQLLRLAEGQAAGGESRCSPDDIDFRGFTAAIRAYVSLLNSDTVHAIELCHQGLTLLADNGKDAPAHLVFALGSAYWVSGDLSMASRSFKETFTIGKETGDFYDALLGLAFQAVVQAEQRNLHEAAETNRQSIRLGTQWGGDEPLPATSYGHIGLAGILYQWNRLEDAKCHVCIGIDLAERCADPTAILMGHLTLARLKQAEGDLISATDALTKVGNVISAFRNVLWTHIAAAGQARILLMQGHLAAAEEWALSLKCDFNSCQIPGLWYMSSFLTWVRVQIARAKVSGIPGLLENVRRQAEESGWMSSIIEILLLESLALRIQGRVDQSLAVLQEALSIAEPEGYVRVFVEEGAPMKELLNHAVARGIAPGYTSRLLDVFRPARLPPGSPVERPEAKQGDVSSETTPSATHPNLSARELEVLRLVAIGTSAREIADALIIEVGTAKKHINNIYCKLDVHNRTLAISRARALHLL